MTITIDNYSGLTRSIDFKTLPEPLQKAHEYVKKVTMNFSSKTAYDTSPSIKKVIDQYFTKLEPYIPIAKKRAEAPSKKEPKAQPNQVAKETPKREEKVKPVKSTKPKEIKKVKEENVELVERIPDELKLMRRFINLDNKIKTYDQLLSLINSLQRAILEKRIRKTSAYAKQIEYMQTKLIAVYNERKGESVTVKIVPKTKTEFADLIHSEKVFASVQFIKRFISLHGKTGVKEKAQRLFDSFNRAVKRGVLLKTDKYATRMNEVWKLLEKFIKDENETRLSMDEETLSGLAEVAEELGCNCGISGLGDIEDVGGVVETDSIMNHTSTLNSMDFMNMKFNTIGLKGKWHELIGDPAPGFTAMVFGKPKKGKSFLCVEFAGYLARNHGKVLYIAREEGLYATLQMKLHDKQVEHPNLYISDDMPEDLTDYDFIFIDTVSKMGLTPMDLDKLRKNNPKKSFIFVFQTTKDGHFRGANTYQHDVDIVIEVGENGKAVQYGRYNQGGEINIFSHHPQPAKSEANSI